MKKNAFITVAFMLFCATLVLSGCGIAGYRVVKDAPAPTTVEERSVWLPIEKTVVTTDLTADQALAERYKGIRLERLNNRPDKGTIIAGKLYCRGTGTWDRQVVIYNDDRYIPPYNHPVWEYTLTITFPTASCDASTNDTSPGYRSFPR